MLKWVLILAMNGQQALHGGYQTESDCEKAAMQAVEVGKKLKQRVTAGCYQKVSVTSWSGS